MNRSFTTIASILLFAITAFSQTSLKIDSPAPMFSVVKMDGTTIDLADLRGRVVVMTFWSTRCAICHRELPKLSSMTARFDPAKVVFLALSIENEEKISGFLRKNPFRFQIVPNSFNVVLQYADRDRAGNLDMGFPSFFVIDQQGTIKHRSSGYDKMGGIESAIGKLVAK